MIDDYRTDEPEKLRTSIGVATLRELRARRNGPYCSECGQKELSGRQTIRGLLRSVLERTINLEEGLTHTAYGLTVRPGEVVRDFLNGRTVRYTHPVPYFMLALGIFVLVFRFINGPTGAAESDRLITILVIPYVALASRLLSWRTPRNYAEHLIAWVYLSGHSLVLATVLWLGIPLLGDGYITVYAVAGLGIVLGYFLWAYGQAFFGRVWLGALVGLISFLAGIAAWAASVAVSSTQELTGPAS